MRIGTFFATLLIGLVGLILSMLTASAPRLSDQPTRSVRVSSVKARRIPPPPPPSSGGSSSGGGRYSSGGGYSSGK